MSSEGVQQLGVLADLFAEALAFSRPQSVAVLGIAGGNGLEHVDSTVTKRVVGIDLNSTYLEAVAHRYSSLPGLELRCADLVEQSLNIEPVQLVHVALVFEHAGLGRCLENALSLVAPGGALSVVLQLPSKIEQGVSATPFASIQSLKSLFSFVDVNLFRETIQSRGFRLARETMRTLPAGKAFWWGVFERN